MVDQTEPWRLDIPDWVPAADAERARRLHREMAHAPAAHVAVERRLVGDLRMQAVRGELAKRSRATGEFLNLSKSGEPRSQVEQETAMGILFDCAVAHGRNAVSDSAPESLRETLNENLDRLRRTGGGMLPEMFAFGAAATREKAFVLSMAPIMRDLFGGEDGNSRVGTLATLTRVVLGSAVKDSQVRAWCRSRDRRTKR